METQIEIRVSDNGPGIPNEIKEKISNHFLFKETLNHKISAITGSDTIKRTLNYSFQIFRSILKAQLI